MARYMMTEERQELARKLEREGRQVQSPELVFLAELHRKLANVERRLEGELDWLHGVANRLESGLKTTPRMLNRLGEVQGKGADIDTLCARREELIDVIDEFCKIMHLTEDGNMANDA